MSIMTRWLSDEEMRAWRGLVEGFIDVHASLDAELFDGHGISEGEYAVLVQLSEADDHRLRMCDLATKLHLSPSGLTRRIDGLVRSGFVVRETGPRDRRVAFAVLTDAGFAKLETAAPDHVAGVRRHLLDHLSPTQIRQLGNAFESLRRGRSAALNSAVPEAR